LKDVKSIDSRSLRSYSVNVLFRNILNQDQIDNISQLIRVLSRYMIMDRSMINIRARNPVGLSYIQKAVNYGLVTELQYKDDEGQRNKFFFQLNVAGIYFAENVGYKLNAMPLDTSRFDKQKILTFNKWSIDRKYELDNVFPMRRKFDIFICKLKERNIAAYYPKLTDKEKVVNFIYKILNPKDEVIVPRDAIERQYQFETIDEPLMDYGNKTAGNEFSEILE
jgi:hypothetical protein